MISGHYATALVANRYASKGAIVYFLVASQLLDLLWLVFHYLGLEPTEPDNFMHVSLDKLQVDMTYSHDVIPVIGWMVLTAVFGRLVFKSWKVGAIGGLLVFVHAITDYVGGFTHHVFGPDTLDVTTGLYYSAPNLAVLLELLFIVAMLGWVVYLDRKEGVKRGLSTWIVWILVFGGSTLLMFLTTDASLAERMGLESVEWMSGSAMPMLIFNYTSMLLGLVWANRQPAKPA